MGSLVTFSSVPNIGTPDLGTGRGIIRHGAVEVGQKFGGGRLVLLGGRHLLAGAGGGDRELQLAGGGVDVAAALLPRFCPILRTHGGYRLAFYMIDQLRTQAHIERAEKAGLDMIDYTKNGNSSVAYTRE